MHHLVAVLGTVYGSIHDASKPPPWLGGKNARFAQRLDGTAKDFVQLASALPALVLMMTEMHLWSTQTYF